jgi:hypothetical protein
VEVHVYADEGEAIGAVRGDMPQHHTWVTDIGRPGEFVPPLAIV